MTRLGLFVVRLSEEPVLLLSVLFKLGVVFLWSDESFGLLFSEALALLRFLRLSSSVRNFLLCRLLAVLYAKYLWERILDATSGVKSDVILSLSCCCSCSLMAMILWSALLLPFRTKRFILCLDFSVMDSTPKSYGSLRFSIVFGKMLNVECQALAEEEEPLFAGSQRLAVAEYIFDEDKFSSAQAQFQKLLDVVLQ